MGASRGQVRSDQVAVLGLLAFGGDMATQKAPGQCFSLAGPHRRKGQPVLVLEEQTPP